MSTASTAASATLPRRSVLFAMYAVIAAISLTWSVVMLIDSLSHPQSFDPQFGTSLLRWLILLLIVPLNIVIGVLILRRSPGNVIGLYLLIFAAAWSIGQARKDFDSLAVLALNSQLQTPMWMSLMTLPLVFPTGWAYPPRFARLVDWFLALLALTGFITSFTTPTFIAYDVKQGTSYSAANPFFLPAIEPLGVISSLVSQIFGLAMFGLSLISIILRYRASDRHGKMQIRWLLLAFAVTVVFAFSGFSFKLFIDMSTFDRASLPYQIFNLAFYLWIYLFPAVTLGNAILRHRLYDIDIIIRRTLIYSILSAILALVFFGGVTITQGVLQTATGQSSDLAIVVSTLIIAALFTPLRRRVQQLIDRRFYRRKYDAQKTLEQFSQMLRDETNLESLQTSMLDVVRETMQPNKIGLWLREKGQ